MPRPHSTREIQPQYLLILLGPISVYLLLEFLLKSFGDGGFGPTPGALTQNAAAQELIGRYRFLAAFAFFGATSLAVLAVFAVDLWTGYTRRTLGLAVLGILGGAGFGLVLSVLEPEALGNFETYFLRGRALFEEGLGQGRTGLCGAAAAAACTDWTAFDMFQRLSDPINALTSFSAAAAMTGMILALADGKGADPAEAVQRGQRVVQRYLYCAGLLLTAGMIFFLAWASWPAGMIADAGARADYDQLVNAISLYVGVGYSVMILSCYLPVSLLLARRSREVADALSDAGEDASALRDSGDYLVALRAVLAILSPLLASAVGSFGQGVLFGG